MSDPRLTEERLRSWLQSQAERERLCTALLPMFGDYRDVRPRRPRGGPDGGRDIEARLREDVVWGAVGFQDHATDSRESRSLAVRKFQSDLDAASTENPELRGFLFFTNVDLPPGMVEELEMAATSRGVVHVEVFHRERLRAKLDSTPGLGLRLQFLSIAMTVEEQTAFVHYLSTSHDARLGELALLLDAVRASVSRLEEIAKTTVEAVRLHAERTISAVTGGDSYCTLAFGNDDPSAVINHGPFPLYDVSVRIVDLNSDRPTGLGSTVHIGNLPPGLAMMVRIPFTWAPGDSRRANIFFQTRNGIIAQLLRGYKVDGQWLWAYRVTRYDRILAEEIPDALKSYPLEFK